jgi:hypothetical protein
MEGENRRTQTEIRPSAKLSTTNYHNLAWDRSWFSAVKAGNYPPEPFEH